MDFRNLSAVITLPSDCQFLFSKKAISQPKPTSPVDKNVASSTATETRSTNLKPLFVFDEKNGAMPMVEVKSETSHHGFWPPVLETVEHSKTSRKRAHSFTTALLPKEEQDNETKLAHYLLKEEGTNGEEKSEF